MCKKIMIVDDDQVYHDIYTDMLENTDYKLIHAYDGDEALQVLEQEKPDLIILDMIMDMVTGDTFFLYLKSIPEYTDIPIIVISCKSKRDYKSLKDIDPNLIFLNKMEVNERLIEEIKAKIGSENVSCHNHFNRNEGQALGYQSTKRL